MCLKNENSGLYSEQFNVKCYTCDMNKNFSPVYALRIAQDAADKHLNTFGLSYDELLKIGSVFLLSAIEVSFYRPIAMNEEITVNTWQRAVERVRFIRDAEFIDSNGKRAALCTQNWFLADPIKHRIKRPKDMPECERVPSLPEKVPGTDAISVKLPDDLTKAYDYTVHYTDLDYNHHMNNTNYARLVIDCMPECFKERYVKSLKLVFRHEALLGDTITLYSKTDGDTVFVRGETENGICFEGEAIFE